MRQSLIEERIVAYFEGMLSDEESAELLHRVSVSPEIRELFRQHEILRTLAQNAPRAVVIRPEVETALFNRVQALKDEEDAVIAPLPPQAIPAVTRRFATKRYAALLLLLFASTVGVIALTNRGTSTNETNLANSPVQPQASASAPESSVASEPEPSAAAVPATSATAPQANAYTQSSVATIRSVASTPTMGKGSATTLEPGTTILAVDQRTAASTTLEGTIGQVIPMTAGAVENRHMPITTPSSVKLWDVEGEEAPMFEATLETSSGFAYPASGPSVYPFADHRLTVGYLITPNNIGGLRLISGIFELLPFSSRSEEGGMVIVRRGLESRRAFSPEVFYTHRESIELGRPIFIDATLAAGLVPGGSSLSAELGLKLPVNDRLLASVSFGLSRIASNAPSMQRLIEAESGDDRPVIFEGSDIRKTLKGKLHYGISYRF